MDQERSSRPWVVALLGACLLSVATMGLMRGPEVPQYATPEADPAIEIVGAPRSVHAETMLHLRSTLDPTRPAGFGAWTIAGPGEPLTWERAAGPDQWEPAWFVFLDDPDGAYPTRAHLEPVEERFFRTAGMTVDHVDVLTPPEPGTYRLCVGATDACVRLTIGD